MLFRSEFLEGIRNGDITLAFRRWRRPSVQAGGTLLTPVGQLSIQSVELVALETISSAEANRAGYHSKEALLEALRARAAGDVYRIELGPLRPDPRIALRMTDVGSATELQHLQAQLRRLDSRAPNGAWTCRTLQVLEDHPGICAGDICNLVGQDKEQFKLNVRKLKKLGLTESLQTGYRLAPRGEALLRVLRLKPSSGTSSEHDAADEGGEV
jgi:hypothetical protein